MKSPWTWLSTCIFQNILEYSITLLCTYTCTFCPHSHTKTRQRLDNNFQSENLPLLIFPKLLKRMHGISCWWYTCKHFSVTNNVIEHLYSFCYVLSIAVGIVQWLRHVILPLFLMNCCIKPSENFVEGPWFVLFYLTLVPSLKYKDYQTSSQLIFLLCKLFLLQAFSFKLWILMLSYIHS